MIGKIVRQIHPKGFAMNAAERGCRRLKAPRVLSTWFAREPRPIPGVPSR
jgi:hypothetical protein